MTQQTAETAAEPASPPSPLRRSRGNKVISGVCGGLGRHFDLDPVIFRVVLAVLAIAGGVGLIAYGFAWLLIPLEGEDENEGRRLLSGRVEGQALTAILFALVGCGLLLSMIGNPTVLYFSLVVSGVVAGAAHWSKQRRHAGQERSAADAMTAHATAEAPPETQAPPTRCSHSWWRDPLTKEGLSSTTTDTGYLWGPDDGLPWDRKDRKEDRKEDRKAPDARGSVGPERERPTWIGGWIFLLAASACAIGIGVSWDGRPLGTSLQTGLAFALAVFGLGLVVSAWFGRTGGGTVLLALVTSGLLAGAAALPKSVTSDWAHSRTEWTPASASTVRPDYTLGTGVGTLDLSGVQLNKDQTVATRATVGTGKLKVLVPENATLKLDVKIGVGDLRLPGERREDIDVAPGLREEYTLKPANGREASGTLDLELEAGLGQVEVSRATP